MISKSSTHQIIFSPCLYSSSQQSSAKQDDVVPTAHEPMYKKVVVAHEQMNVTSGYGSEMALKQGPPSLSRCHVVPLWRFVFLMLAAWMLPQKYPCRVHQWWELYSANTNKKVKCTYTDIHVIRQVFIGSVGGFWPNSGGRYILWPSALEIVMVARDALVP